MGKTAFIVLIVVASFIGLLVILATVIYFWPFTSPQLQTSKAETFSYQQAMDRIKSINDQESSEGVEQPCHSRLYTHGTKTAKTVVMFHGITACPKQFHPLAQKFYDSGYNVYVPRAPHHGFADGKTHSKVTAKELVDYVTASVNIASGLGDEKGVVGLSGGGMLATWAAEYRPDIKHLLVLSPFYEPSGGKAPKWQLPFFYFLYGYRLLPDTFVEPIMPTDASFSYAALANYGIVSKNLKSDSGAPGLASIAVVTSEGDDQIDLYLANQIPADIAKAQSLHLWQTTLPKSWKIGHNIIDPADKAVAEHQDALYNLYFSYYEGRDYK